MDGKYSYFLKKWTNFKITIIDNVDEVDFVDAIAPDGEALDAGIETDVAVDLAGWILLDVMVFDDVADDVFEAVLPLTTLEVGVFLLSAGLLKEMVLGKDFKRLLYEAVYAFK